MKTTAPIGAASSFSRKEVEISTAAFDNLDVQVGAEELNTDGIEVVNEGEDDPPDDIAAFGPPKLAIVEIDTLTVNCVSVLDTPGIEDDDTTADTMGFATLIGNVTESPVLPSV